ncbi:hypothetical protein [Streptomyces sp. Ru62]|uniref:hypothetical protein n=1 Tax=Streptomyces sp. Ru62 TaxID=2080745 RepID=UPI0015E44E34|nr:hypothetical protein [Streptomyces sp. Ru62]
MLQGRRVIGRDLDGLLRAHAATEGITLPNPRTVSNPFDSTLVRIGARLLTGGMADVSPEELTDAWRSVWTGPPEQLERMTAAHVAADEAETDLRALSPLTNGLPGLVHALERADGILLCEAVRACTKASSTLMKLLQERAGPEVLAELMDDVMWDQWVRAGGVAPVGRLGEAAITLSTVQYLLVPGWAEDLHRYQHRMERLLAGGVESGEGAADGGRQGQTARVDRRGPDAAASHPAASRPDEAMVPALGQPRGPSLSEMQHVRAGAGSRRAGRALGRRAGRLRGGTGRVLR